MIKQWQKWSRDSWPLQLSQVIHVLLSVSAMLWCRDIYLRLSTEVPIFIVLATYLSITRAARFHLTLLRLRKLAAGVIVLVSSLFFAIIYHRTHMISWNHKTEITDSRGGICVCVQRGRPHGHWLARDSGVAGNTSNISRFQRSAILRSSTTRTVKPHACG